MSKGVLLIAVGVGMVVFDLALQPVFSIPITASFSFPVGLLAVLVGVLYVVSAKIAVENANLTPGEIAIWGKQLELATPRIIALSEQQWSTGAIAKELNAETEIPQEILIKYMYAMRRYLEDLKADTEAKERRQL